MAVCDHEYKFTMVDIGANGRFFDSSVFKHCNFGKKLESGKMPLPQTKLVGGRIHMPAVLVGDEAFPLKMYLFRPFPARKLNHNRRCFNYRLSRARRVIENAFGILAARFRIFRRPIDTCLSTAISATKCCTVLHNFLMQKSDSYMSAPIDDKRSDAFVEGRRQAGANRCGGPPVAVREELAAFFASDEGKLPWQDDFC